MDDAKILGYSHLDNFHTASIFVNYAQTIHMKDICYMKTVWLRYTEGIDEIWELFESRG